MAGFLVSDQLAAFGEGGETGDLGILKINGFVLLQNLFMIPLMFSWMLSGLMIGGIALMRSGFFSGEWKAKWYGLLIALGVVVSVPATIFVEWAMAGDGDGAESSAWFFLAQPIGLPLSLAYASIVILVV